MNYHNKKFKSVQFSKNSEIDKETIFNYQQIGKILTCKYKSKTIKTGHLIGKVDDLGNIEMSYHQINKNDELMTGKCFSKPEILANGKIRLLEKWQWTSGDLSEGTSVLEEI